MNHSPIQTDGHMIHDTIHELVAKLYNCENISAGNEPKLESNNFKLVELNDHACNSRKSKSDCMFHDAFDKYSLGI